MAPSKKPVKSPGNKETTDDGMLQVTVDTVIDGVIKENAGITCFPDKKNVNDCFLDNGNDDPARIPGRFHHVSGTGSGFTMTRGDDMTIITARSGSTGKCAVANYSDGKSQLVCMFVDDPVDGKDTKKSKIDRHPIT